MKHWYYLLKYFNSMAMRFHKIKLFNDKEIGILEDKALFLIGDKDRLAYSKEVADILENKNLDYKIIKDTGHGINHEQAAMINEEIIGHLI